VSRWKELSLLLDGFQVVIVDFLLLLILFIGVC
jgi:hypothetical protein